MVLGENRAERILPAVLSAALHAGVLACLLAYDTRLTAPSRPPAVTVTIDTSSMLIAPGADVTPTPVSPAAPPAVPDVAPTADQSREEVAPSAAPAAVLSDAGATPAASTETAPADVTPAAPSSEVRAAATPETVAAAAPTPEVPSGEAVAQIEPAAAPPAAAEAQPAASGSPDLPQAIPAGNEAVAETMAVQPENGGVAAAAPAPAEASAADILERTAPPSAVAQAEAVVVPNAAPTPALSSQTAADPTPQPVEANAPAPVDRLSPSAPLQEAALASLPDLAPGSLPPGVVTPTGAPPDVASTTLGAEPDQPARPAPVQTARLETGASVSAMRDFVEHYEGGSCFSASVVSASSHAAAIEALSQDKPKFAALNDRFVARFGLDPQILGQRVSDAQCPTVDLLRRSRPGRDRPLLQVDRNRLTGGGDLSGSVDADSGATTGLYLIDDAGHAVNVTRDLRQEGGTLRFTVPIAKSTTGGSVPMILLAVSGRDILLPADPLRGSFDSGNAWLAGKLVLVGGK